MRSFPVESSISNSGRLCSLFSGNISHKKSFTIFSKCAQRERPGRCAKKKSLTIFSRCAQPGAVMRLIRIQHVCAPPHV